MVTRNITPKECSWLPFSINQGMILYTKEDVYKICSKDGISVSPSFNEDWYFEIPEDAIQFVKNDFSLN